VLCLAQVVVSPATAREIAVVVDVSGSMQGYGVWQPSARSAVMALISGQPLPTDWDAATRGAAYSSYALAEDDRVQLVEFGTVDARADYPFFLISHLLNRKQLEQKFPVETARFRQSKTNSTLAEAVAARLLIGSGSPGYVIMISDFRKDVELSPKQLAFVNDMQARYALYTLGTLGWQSNPQVQIKLLKMMPVDGETTGAPPAGDVGRLRLAAAKYNEKNHSVLLGWAYESTEPATKFDVTVRGPRGTTAYSKEGIAANSVTFPKAPAGQFRWTVTAYSPSGGSVQQTSGFTVPEDNSGIAIALLVLSVVAIGVLIGFLAKKYGLPDALAFLKKKNKGRYSEI
jgi:hypothetical protein